MSPVLCANTRIPSPDSSEQTIEANWMAGDVNGKHEFLRSIGLRFNNHCDISSSNKKDISNNNNNNYNNAYDLQAFREGSCRSSSETSEMIGDDENLKNSGSRVMVGCHKTIPSLRECSVTIIGEKCKICGRNFKCIRDVQIHTKKKHRRRKPRKEIVLKIGDEVISRVSIKSKHLKWSQKDKDRTIDSSDGATFHWNVEDVGFDRLIDEESDRCVDVVRGCDRNEAGSRLMDIEEETEMIRERLENTPMLDLGQLGEDGDEEIQVVLKITRPRKSMEINHETPNRNERERLITDACSELIRIDDDLVETIESTRDLQIYQEDDDIIEDYCRLNDGSCNLDNEERNCSFHIENEDTIDCYLQQVNSLLPETNDDIYDGDEDSVHSQHYRNENGDIIPYFIDYTRCLDDRTSSHNNNNDNVYDMNNSFYNERRINEWKKTARDHKPSDFDFVCKNTSGSSESSVLIKEEIMLDDISLINGF